MTTASEGMPAAIWVVAMFCPVISSCVHSQVFAVNHPTTSAAVTPRALKNWAAFPLAAILVTPFSNRRLF
eukprot:5578371-Amphidinium_carterae.1